MPYFVFANGKHIFDFITEPNFKILFFGDNAKNKMPELNNVKIKPLVYSFTEIPVALFKDETKFYILLRPDNHISYIGKNASVCAEMLHKISFH